MHAPSHSLLSREHVCILPKLRLAHKERFQDQPTLVPTFDEVEETNPPAARAIRALRAVLPPRLVAVRSMILPDVEASMVGSIVATKSWVFYERLFFLFIRSALIDWIGLLTVMPQISSSAVFGAVLISSFDILVSSRHRVVLVTTQFPVRSGPYRDQV